jgi:hypothetical protein
MAQKEVKVFDLVEKIELPSVMVNDCPEDGDPLEINHELYYVCERDCTPKGDISSVGVIPLVVKNPKKVENIDTYLNCLSIAHRRVLFRKEGKACAFDDCDEMVIS